MIKSKNVYLETLSDLNRLINLNKWNNFFVVTGKQSYIISGAEKAIAKLHLTSYKRFNDFATNPQFLDLIKGLETFEEGSFDAIIAIGGGSVIDVAKLVFYFQNRKNLHNYFSKQNSSNQLHIKRKLVLIAIPTTSGAGSESTHFAVLYKNRIKYSIGNDLLLPDYYLLIPHLTYNMSPYLTALSGIDAFCQAVESYWSVNSTSTSREYAIEAIKILWNYLPEAVEHPNGNSRKKVQIASNLAGKAINISKTTAPHAISYTMTAMYGVAHGQAVCITLPYFLSYNYNVTPNDLNDSRGIDFVRGRILEIVEAINYGSLEEAQNGIKEFILKIGLHISLKPLSIIKPHQFHEIKSNINFERLKNNPRKISDNFIEDLFDKIK
jgi:alcohol dehydrogenase class IV